MTHLPEGSILHGGMYRIVRFIGNGGFGCTYEALYVGLDKRVAVKEFFVRDFCNRDCGRRLPSGRCATDRNNIDSEFLYVGKQTAREMLNRVRKEMVMINKTRGFWEIPDKCEEMDNVINRTGEK